MKLAAAQAIELKTMFQTNLRKDFTTQAVLARLDAADALDRLQTERRMAMRPPPLDLGEDDFQP